MLLPLTMFMAATPIPSAAPVQQEGGNVLELGSRLELFVDDYLTDTMANLRWQLHPPIRQEVAIEFNAPWEGPYSAYVTVFQDDHLYRMYYRGAREEGPEVTCYAESNDGIHWRKPHLGLFEWEGSKENNIVWTGPGTHNFAPFKDPNPAAPAEHRYKALAGGPLWALVSADGLHWTKWQEEPVITQGAFDSQNLAFWDGVRGRYVEFHRGFREGVRDIMTSTSDDFLHWTEPQWLDYGGAPREHLYTNATTPYFRAPHLLFAFPKRFVPERHAIEEHPHPGVSDGVFMTSRDGVHWDRRFMEGFIRPGLDPYNWTQRSNMTAWGLVPTGPGEISLYHSEHYSHPTNRLRRSTLRTDGFVSINAPYAGGELLTKPLTFEGRELVINYSTSAVGSVQVEIQDAAGRPIEGFTLTQCPEIYGDEIERVVAWAGGSDVSALAGKPIRLRFVMKDADLYSIRFRP